MLTNSFLSDVLFYLSIIFVGLYFYFTKNNNYWKHKNVPYIKPLPFVGNILNGLMMRQCMGEIFYDLYYASTRSFVGFFILDKPCLLIRDPGLIKKMLVSDFNNFYDRNGATNVRDDPISSHMLFFIKNPDWRDIRTKITPLFTSAKIKIMSQLIQNSGEELVDYLKKHIVGNPIVEVKDATQDYTVDVITSTVFGVRSNCFKDKESKFRVVARKLFGWKDIRYSINKRIYFLYPNLVDLFRLKFFDPECIDFLKTSFKNIMSNRSNTQGYRSDLVDILLEIKKDDSNFIEGDKLIAQAVQFFAAGYETTSGTMAFFLYEIASKPEIQAKLRTEINKTWKKHGGCTYEAIKEMEYLEKCIKETLRKYPALPFLDRMCIADYKIPGEDVVIEEGTPVFISTLAMHMDPEYFPDPETFDPERFSDNAEIEEFAYLPLGAGPRHCIGARFGMLTSKTGLAYILKNFKVSVCGETQEKIKFEPNGLLLGAIDGIKLKFDLIK